MKKNIFDQVFQVAPLIIGILMFFVAFFMYQNKKEFLDNSLTTKGIVVDNVDNHRPLSTYAYTTIVSFYTEEGEVIYFSPSLRSNTSIYSVGDVVKVIYNKSNPKDAEIYGFFSLWFNFIIIIILGMFFLFFGLSTNF